MTDPPKKQGAFGRQLVVDITPLRVSREFRRLFLGYLLAFLGRQVTVVAVPYQVFVLTGSSLAVGALGLVQIVPLLIMSLVGGSIADAVDRRKLLVISQMGLALTAVGLAVNSSMDQPLIWVIYVLTGVNAGLSAIDIPARMAVLPSMLQRDLLPAGFALNQAVAQVGGAVGPALAGLLIAQFSLAATYGLEAVLFVFSALTMIGIRPLRPEGGGTAAGWSSVKEGLRYLKGQRLIQSCFLIDLNAMIFGMPRALFPAIGTVVLGGNATTVGLLFAAPGVGAMIAAATAGWVGGVSRRGRVVVVSVIVWGLAITAFGLTTWLPLALGLLAVAGAADVISAVFRNTILQLTVPDALRGRLSAIHGAVVSGGPRLGDLEAGVVAAVTSPQFSVVSGGVLCVVGAFAIARFMPELWRYRSGPGRAPPPPAADPAPA